MPTKVINPYSIKESNQSHPTFIKIEYDEKEGRLSLSGVVHPYTNGNAWGGCGQIIMDFKEYDDRGYMNINDVTPSDGWDYAMIKQLLDYWDKWHLNDMRSACEHQRALGWTYETHHGMFVDVPRKVVVIDEYDDGTANDPIQKWNEYKGHICPECGYSIGSAWLQESVPDHVLAWLFALPSTRIPYAWI